jgi:hypothetical protein
MQLGRERRRRRTTRACGSERIEGGGPFVVLLLFRLAFALVSVVIDRGAHCTGSNDGGHACVWVGVVLCGV